MRRAALLIASAAGLVALAAFAQGPVDTLDKARTRIVERANHIPKYVCTETVDRTYFSRERPPFAPPSCEQMALDRKKGRYKLKLDATDRLRVSVSVAGDHEVYSWTRTAPYTHGVEDVLQSGPVGTGALAAHLLDVFVNPAVKFRLLEERPDEFEFGFRVPVEASTYSMGSPQGWLPTGYSGSFNLDRDSSEVRRFTIDTNELPRETGVCETSTALEFPSGQSPATKWLVPSQSQTHDLMVNATEIDRVERFTDCRESSPVPPTPPAPQGAPLPPGLTITLAFTAPIDTDVAAAGDEIAAATVVEPAYTTQKNIILQPGARVTGRIVRMRRQRNPELLYLISVEFDTLEANGMRSPFYATLVSPHPATEKLLFQPMKLTGHGLKDWPHGIFGFPESREHFVVPALFKSKWLTVKSPQL